MPLLITEPVRDVTLITIDVSAHANIIFVHHKEKRIDIYDPLSIEYRWQVDEYQTEEELEMMKDAFEQNLTQRFPGYEIRFPDKVCLRTGIQKHQINSELFDYRVDFYNNKRFTDRPPVQYDPDDDTTQWHKNMCMFWSVLVAYLVVATGQSTDEITNKLSQRLLDMNQFILELAHTLSDIGMKVFRDDLSSRQIRALYRESRLPSIKRNVLKLVSSR